MRDRGARERVTWDRDPGRELSRLVWPPQNRKRPRSGLNEVKRKLTKW